MSTFEYIPGVTNPSTYAGESIIKVMNGGSTQIPANAFFSAGTARITSGSVSLTFESNSIITFINTEAFKNCSGLTNVTLPASLTGIGLQVFKDCDLTTLTIEPSGSGSSLITGNIANSAGSQAFSGNDGMTVNLNKAAASIIGITVPSQSTSFYGSTAKTVNYPNTFNYKAGGGNATPASDYNGENTILIVNWTNSSGDVAIPANAFEGLISPSGPHPPVGSVSLVFENASQPASNTVLINDKAFYKCPSLTSVTFPTSLTTISPVAFALTSFPPPGQGLSNVTFADIANSLLTTIYSQVFQNQSNLTSITLPKSLLSIQEEAFGNCGLTTLTIEPSGSASSLTSSSINSLAFRYNDGMTVYISKATASNIGITVPSQSTSFYGSTGVITVEYPPVIPEPFFPHPKHEKNKRCHGVNQKLSSGLARLNFKFQTNQFSAGRSRTAQSKQKANGPVTVIFPTR